MPGIHDCEFLFLAANLLQESFAKKLRMPVGVSRWKKKETGWLRFWSSQQTTAQPRYTDEEEKCRRDLLFCW